MFWQMIIWLDLLILVVYSSAAKTCNEDILKDRDQIPESSFKESSYDGNFKGSGARESDSTDMGWCPEKEVHTNKEEYLIIDFGDVYFLNLIMTKGLSRHRFFSASAYILEYKRELDENWRKHKKNGKETKIMGNTDHITEFYRSIDPPIMARWLKIYPYRQTKAKICLVLQIFGCQMKNNILEYMAPDGAVSQNLNDVDYDGIKSNNILRKGLGKLMYEGQSKTESGTEDPFLRPKYALGWNKSILNKNYVEIVFRFDSVRNFTEMIVNFYQLNHKLVTVASYVAVDFSTDGVRYDNEIRVNIKGTEEDVTTTVKLKHNIGRYVRITLGLRTKWIILKNVKFKSTVSDAILIPNNIETDKARTITQTPSILPFPKNNFFSYPLAYILVIVISILLVLMLIIGIPCITFFIRRQRRRNKKCKEALQRRYRDEQIRFLPPQLFKDCPVSGTTVQTSISTLFSGYPVPPPPQMSSSNTAQNLYKHHAGDSSIYTSLAGSDTDSNCHSEGPFPPFCTSSSAVLSPAAIAPSTITLPPPPRINTCPIINPLSNSLMQQPPTNQYKKNNPPIAPAPCILPNDFSATSFMTLNSSSNPTYTPYYAQNPQLARSQINLRAPYEMSTASNNPCILSNDFQNDSFSICAPVGTELRGPLGNTKLYSNRLKNEGYHFTSPLSQYCTSIFDFSLEKRKTIKFISNTIYGNICIAEIPISKAASQKVDLGDEQESLTQHLTQQMEADSDDAEENSEPCSNYISDTRRNINGFSNQKKMIDYGMKKKQIVCIRTLSKNVSDKIRKQFLREVKQLLMLNHTSFPAVMKIEEQPFSSNNNGCIMITEYSASGTTVHKYLRGCGICTSSQSSNIEMDSDSDKNVSVQELIHIASQVASGMHHMQSLELVHRDLACRNLLIISDESGSAYSHNYNSNNRNQKNYCCKQNFFNIKITDLAICDTENNEYLDDYIMLTTSPASNTYFTSSIHRSATSLMHFYQNGKNEGIDSISCVKLPIRWMSWEALLKGDFTSTSDVYAFGVLFWELLTLCRHQPLAELTNEQVIINSNLQAAGDERTKSLAKLPNYAKEFSDFINQCTHKNPVKRPTFRDIDLFLQHKSIDFQSN